MNDFCQKPVPKNIVNLVEQFKRDYDKVKTYNEETIRQNYINPFFNELGWDVYDKTGLREVIPEDKVKIEGKTKAPDYGFYINDLRKFFLEAKKPSIKLHNGSEADKSALQLRRYGWSASLHISILSNFEELVIYNCRVKPHKDDSASKARIKYFTFEQYVAHWAEIWNLLSRDALVEGKLEKYVEQEESKRFLKSDIIPVDDDFLQVIEKWRENLAKSLIKRNNLSVYELNFGVQTIINRIVFLRICEDLGIEPYQTLFKAAETRNYQVLCKLFREADNRYNSGLFHFTKENARTEPDKLTLNLNVDESYLHEIVRNIYPPNSPYEFSVIPVELLGHIYEQFLGKIIVLDRKKNSVFVEDKPEVRKAGGVYYTPDYIVNYIVENTIGKLLAGKTPQQAEKIKILDPACGSGSFLVGAYNYLLTWYKKHYKKNKLTAQEKKRILLNNIYGVDIDRQAVEVTKLSLLLKVLEGETERSIDREKILFKERILPDLDNNIKCGNSLINSDFYDNEQNDILDEELRHKVNTFDWDSESGFAKIMKNGGFDAVIGNPPYGAELSKNERHYLTKKFPDLGTTDSAALMMVNAKNLSKTNAYNSFIIPKSFTYSSTWSKLRHLMLAELQTLADAGKVWNQVKLEQTIYMLIKNSRAKNYKSFKRLGEKFLFLTDIEKIFCIQFDFYLNGIDNEELKIGQKIFNTQFFLKETISNVRGGMFQESVTNMGKWKVLGGKHIQRYFIKGEKGRISNTSILKKNAFVKSDTILVQNIVAHIVHPIDHIKIIATIIEPTDSKQIVILDTVNQLTNSSNFSSKYLLGLLLSRLMNWYIYRFIFAKAIRTMHFDNPVSNKIPIPKLNLRQRNDKKNHDKIVKFVDRMLILHKQLNSAKISQDKQLIQRQIDKTDKEIDQLVYQLYDLTAEEIEIVESAI